MVAAFKAINTMKMTLLSLMVMNLVQITPQEIIPDLEENESEVENFDICDVRKIRKKHLSVGSVQVALYIRFNWL